MTFTGTDLIKYFCSDQGALTGNPVVLTKALPRAQLHVLPDGQCSAVLPADLPGQQCTVCLEVRAEMLILLPLRSSKDYLQWKNTQGFHIFPEALTGVHPPPGSLLSASQLKCWLSALLMPNQPGVKAPCAVCLSSSTKDCTNKSDNIELDLHFKCNLFPTGITHFRSFHGRRTTNGTHFSKPCQWLFACGVCDCSVAEIVALMLLSGEKLRVNSCETSAVTPALDLRSEQAELAELSNYRQVKDGKTHQLCFFLPKAGRVQLKILVPAGTPALALVQSLAAQRWAEHRGLPRVIQILDMFLFLPLDLSIVLSPLLSSPHTWQSAAQITLLILQLLIQYPELFSSHWNIWSAPWHGLLDGFERKFPWECPPLKRFLLENFEAPIGNRDSRRKADFILLEVLNKLLIPSKVIHFHKGEQNLNYFFLC